MSNDIIIQSVGEGIYGRNLIGYTPPARFGESADPWSEVRVEEATGKTGPWVELASGPLEPADADPTEPATWNITVTGAALPTGWYRAVWLDTNGNEQPTDPAFFGPPIRPTVREIGALLHARTTADGGGEIGTFNDDTDPTGETVDNLIGVALDQVAIQLPDTLTDKQVAQARRMVGYLAAILVENSHFSEQVTSGDSLAAMYQTFYDAGMLTLTGSVDGDLPGGPSAFSITTETDTQDLISANGRTYYGRGWDCP